MWVLSFLSLEFARFNQISLNTRDRFLLISWLSKSATNWLTTSLLTGLHMGKNSDFLRSGWFALYQLAVWFSAEVRTHRKKAPYFLYSFDMKFQTRWGLASTEVSTTEDCAMFVTGSYLIPVLICYCRWHYLRSEKIGKEIFIAGDSAPIDITANPQIVAEAPRLVRRLFFWLCDGTDTVQVDDGNGVSLLVGLRGFWICGFIFDSYLEGHRMGRTWKRLIFCLSFWRHWARTDGLPVKGRTWCRNCVLYQWKQQSWWIQLCGAFTCSVI